VKVAGVKKCIARRIALDSRAHTTGDPVLQTQAAQTVLRMERMLPARLAR
jgi:hypothetical protein